MRMFLKGLTVVIGATVLAPGVLFSTPAAAQLHRSDVGTGLVVGTYRGMADGVETARGYGSCSLQRQRIWDGFGWRVEQVEACD